MKHWKLMRRANATTKIALRNSRRSSTLMRARGSLLKSNIRTTICLLSAIKRFSSAGPGKRKMPIQTLTHESDPAFKQLHENVKAFTSYLDKGLEEADKRQDATVSRCRVLILTLAALGFLLGAAVSGMTIRTIRSSMFRSVATMQQVAADADGTGD